MNQNTNLTSVNLQIDENNDLISVILHSITTTAYSSNPLINQNTDLTSVKLQINQNTDLTSIILQINKTLILLR